MTIENICARCNTILTNGKTAFYEVKIEAVADRGSPDLEDLSEDYDDPRETYREMIEALKGVSAQEAMDEIATSRMIFLCNGCFSAWIDDPASHG